MSERTLGHLQRHHGDFHDFRDRMIDSHGGRFDAVFWGVWDQWVHPALPVEARLLDLGTGPGGLLRDLAHRYPTAHLVGVDVQPAMLEAAENLSTELGDRARVVNADVSRPPIEELKTGHFDGIVLSMVLHEMHVPQNALAEARRLLAPDGRLMIYDWTRHDLRRYVAGNLDGTEEQILHFAEHCRYTPEDYVFLAEAAGFSPLEVVTRRSGANMLMVLRKS